PGAHRALAGARDQRRVPDLDSGHVGDGVERSGPAVEGDAQVARPGFRRRGERDGNEQKEGQGTHADDYRSPRRDQKLFRGPNPWPTNTQNPRPYARNRPGTSDAGQLLAVRPHKLRMLGPLFVALLPSACSTGSAAQAPPPASVGVVEVAERDVPLHS